MYLETGTVPIKWIIGQRRVNYLKTILKKDTNELVRKVFEAQKDNPSQGDFVKLVESGIKDLGVTYDEVICNTKENLKKKLKINARNASFLELKSKLGKHKKVKHLEYNLLQVQPYLRNGNLHNEEACTITALRSKCVKNVKSHFSSIHKDRIYCPLLCNSESPEIDTQEHVLTCKSLKIENPTKLTIDSANSDIPQQVEIGKIICKALKKRKKNSLKILRMGPQLGVGDP